MCGINGIYNHLILNDSKNQVLKMNQSSSHRGPDNQGLYYDNDIILGHVRLSIIDLDSRSHQPFISTNKEIILSFNGEIYNFQELKKELNDYHFITNSDTEVVVAAYLKWGITFLDKLDGMFAFALWDKSHKQLLLARDKMGVKPLYYFEKNNTIVFSSEIRSLLNCDLVDRKLNSSSIQDYLQYSTVHGPNTIVEGIKLLPSGSYLQVNEHDFSINSFWDIRTRYSLKPSSQSFEEIQIEIKDLFNKAVQKRLFSDVSYGAFLSGGIDSSAVVAAAANTSSKQIKTFCVSFEDKQFDESRYAQIVADIYSTDHQVIKLSANDFLDDIPNALSSMDHPSVDGPNSYVVAKAAKAAGVTMALSGLGGDELFAGYDIFHRAFNLLDKKWLFSFPPGIRKFIGLLIRAVKPSISSDKIADIINQKYLELTHYYPIYRNLFTEKDLKNLIGSTKLKKTHPFTFGNDNLLNSKMPFLSKVSYLEMNTYMQHVLLRDTDQMSMAHSLEVRVPMLDSQLVEYVYGVKDTYKFGKFPKNLLVSSIGNMLPNEVVNRPKMGFVLPWNNWMRNELKDFNISQLDYLKKINLLNNKEIDSIYNKFQSNSAKISWSKIWSLVVLSNWLNQNKIEI